MARVFRAMSPGEVTTVIVRFGPQRSEQPSFAFDATAEPGYVWHCHILEHEDNEMMRPYKLQAPLAQQAAMAPVTEEAAAVVADEAPMVCSAKSPAAGRADLQFRRPRGGKASLRVYGVDGRLVKVLAEGTFNPGTHAVAWGADDESGVRVPAGIYFVSLEANGVRTNSRIVLTPLSSACSGGTERPLPHRGGGRFAFSGCIQGMVLLYGAPARTDETHLRSPSRFITFR